MRPGRFVVSALLSTLTTACSGDLVWVPPPATSGTVLLRYDDGALGGVEARAFDSERAVVLDGVSSFVEVEAAVFTESLEELELEEGEVTSSILPDRVTVADASEFYELGLVEGSGLWVQKERPSGSFASFALPIEAPAPICPQFDIQEVIIENSVRLAYGGTGPDGSILLGAVEVVIDQLSVSVGRNRIYQLWSDGRFELVEVADSVPPFERAIVEAGRGYWVSFGGAVYEGTIVDGKLEPTQTVSSSVGPALEKIRGSSTNPDEVYGITADDPDDGLRRWVRLDGDRWETIADLPGDANDALEWTGDEVVVVSDKLDESVHLVDGRIQRHPISLGASLVRHIPGERFGLLAGGRSDFLRFSNGRWRDFAFGSESVRVRDMVAYDSSFFVVYDSSLALFRPELGSGDGEFCPSVDVPYTDLTFGAVLDGKIIVYPHSDSESTSLRAYILEERR